MTEKYTPEKVAELVAELEGFAAGSESARATLMRDAADALTAVSTERDRLDESFDRDLPWRYSEVLEQVKTMRADRDRLHKAITEALAGLELSAEPDWPGWNVLTGTENILHAALDKEGNDDGRAGSRPARPVIDREALIHAIAARHWDEDSGDVENWDGLTASERQNVIDNYLCPRVADAVIAHLRTAPVLPPSGVDEDNLAKVIDKALIRHSEMAGMSNQERWDARDDIARAVAEWLKEQGGESR